MRDFNGALGQVALQAVQAQMGHRPNPLGDEVAVGARTDLRCSHMLPADTDAIAHRRWDYLTTKNTAISNRSATDRQLSPAKTVAATNSRRPFEREQIVAGWHSSPASILNPTRALLGFSANQLIAEPPYGNAAVVRADDEVTKFATYAYLNPDGQQRKGRIAYI